MQVLLPDEKLSTNLVESPKVGKSQIAEEIQNILKAAEVVQQQDSAKER